MNELEKQLVLVYSIICLVLIVTHLIILFYDEVSKLRAKAILILSLLSVAILPIFAWGIFVTFVTLYGIVSAMWKDDFLMAQIAVNAVNFVMLYQIIKLIIDKRRHK